MHTWYIPLLSGKFAGAAGTTFPAWAPTFKTMQIATYNSQPPRVAWVHNMYTMRPVFHSQAVQQGRECELLPYRTRLARMHSTNPTHLYGWYWIPNQGINLINYARCTPAGIHQPHASQHTAAGTRFPARAVNYNYMKSPRHLTLLLPLPLHLPHLGRLLRLLVPLLGRPTALRHAPANKMQIVNMEGGHHHPLRHHDQSGL